MASLSFYLDHSTNGPFKRIYYSLSHHSKQYRNSLGRKIHEKDWDRKKNFLKSSARNKEHILLRKKLIEYVNFVNVECLIEDPDISFEQLKYRFLEKLGRKNMRTPDGPVDLVQAHEMYAKRLEDQKYSVSGVNHFRRNASLLKMFFDEKGYSYDIRTYTQIQKKKFLEEWVEFLAYRTVTDRFGEVIKRQFENVTVKKCLETLKTCVVYYEFPIIVNLRKIFPQKVFTVTEGEALHFTTEEIMCLYRYQPKEDYHKNILDMLVFCAFTGLRHGELPYVKRSTIETRKNIEGKNYMVFRRYSPKENNTNHIPLNTVCRELIEKHMARHDKDVIFPVRSNMWCNRELHKLMRDADEMFHKNYTRIRHIGTEEKEEEKPRWKALTFHSARHHYSYYLRKIGLGIEDASVMLNHKDSNTTYKFYRHEEVDKIVEETYNKMDVADSMLKVI